MNKKLDKYLTDIYIPFGAMFGVVAVILGGIYIISPWITVLYILLWSSGYFLLNKMVYVK
jgi:hypothetical protein